MNAWHPQSLVSETETGTLEVYWATNADERSWWWKIDCKHCKHAHGAPAGSRDEACKAAEAALATHAQTHTERRI